MVHIGHSYNACSCHMTDPTPHWNIFDQTRGRNTWNLHHRNHCPRCSDRRVVRQFRNAVVLVAEAAEVNQSQGTAVLLASSSLQAIGIEGARGTRLSIRALLFKPWTKAKTCCTLVLRGAGCIESHACFSSVVILKKSFGKICEGLLVFEAKDTMPDCMYFAVRLMFSSLNVSLKFLNCSAKDALPLSQPKAFCHPSLRT